MSEITQKFKDRIHNRKNSPNNLEIQMPSLDFIDEYLIDRSKFDSVERLMVFRVNAAFVLYRGLKKNGMEYAEKPAQIAQMLGNWYIWVIDAGGKMSVRLNVIHEQILAMSMESAQGENTAVEPPPDNPLMEELKDAELLFTLMRQLYFIIRKFFEVYKNRGHPQSLPRSSVFEDVPDENDLQKDRMNEDAATLPG